LAQKVNKDEITNGIYPLEVPGWTYLYADLPEPSEENKGGYLYCIDGDGINGAGNYVSSGSSWYFGGTGDQGYNKLKSEIEQMQRLVYTPESEYDLSSLTWKYGALTISGNITGTSSTTSIYADIPYNKNMRKMLNDDTSNYVVTYVFFDKSNVALGQRTELTDIVFVPEEISKIRVAIRYQNGTNITDFADLYTHLRILLAESVIIKKVNGITASNGEVEITADDINTTEYTEINDFVLGSYIATNVGVGNAIDITPVSSIAWQHIIIPVKEGDRFIVTATGGNAPKAWALTDSAYTLLSVASGDAVDKMITAESNGYLIVNSLRSAETKLLKVAFNSVGNILKDHEERMQNFEEKIKTSNNIPMVKFEFDHEVKDVSEELAKIDYTDFSSILPTIYTLFDSLVAYHSDYVTKYDLAELLDMEYPEYAKGVSNHPIYLNTPQYYTYMYKFSCSNKGAGNETANKKKVFLLISGVHGSENAAPFNTYLFAKQLCDSDDPNFFKFRSAFDIYIVPYLNGYGAYHKNEQPRVNANGVNINRNFPVAKWKVSGEGTTNYSGPYAGSEFETQLIVGLTNLIKPDLAIDHHNYMYEDQAFYTLVMNEDGLRLAHQSLVDCSFAFIKNYPQYFGTYYQLFIPDSNIASAPRAITSDTAGISCVWWKEQGVKFPALVEVCDRIRYVNGEPDSTHLTGVFSDTAFSVAEYTLRNQIFRYAQYVLDND